MRVSRLVALAAVASLALSGCGGIKERKERAERIIGSVDRAVAAKSALLSVSVDQRVTLERTARVAAGASEDGGALPTIKLDAQADLARDRAAYLAVDAAGASTSVRIYSGTTIYGRRLTQTASTTQRPWVRLDLTTVDPDEVDDDSVGITDAFRQIGESQGVQNPLFLLKLLRGTLTGSVTDLGEAEVRGVPTRHYKLNIDREKAVKDEDESVQDAYEVVFKTMFATRTVFPGEVWLDEQGVPRRYAITLKSSIRRKSLAEVRFTVELFDVGHPVQIDLPTKGETASVDGLGSLTQALTGGGG